MLKKILKILHLLISFHLLVISLILLHGVGTRMILTILGNRRLTFSW